VVTGVDVTNGVAHLNDSGTEDGRDEQVPMPPSCRLGRAAIFEMTVTQENGAITAPIHRRAISPQVSGSQHDARFEKLLRSDNRQ
jgi:hypothetical protein